MDATSSQNSSAGPEHPKRLLDPFAEWGDHANQWDVTEVWRRPGEVAQRPSPLTPLPEGERGK